jgi:hypothetical protein
VTDSRIKVALIGTMFMKMSEKEIKEAISRINSKFGS